LQWEIKCWTLSENMNFVFEIFSMIFVYRSSKFIQFAILI
jgi:hypothetical protein